MKAISYSLFGYNAEKHKDCFDFNSYLRGLALNIRMARLVYPEWEIVLHVDESTNNGLKELFERLPIKVVVCENAPLTKAMLWRLKPCFDHNYSHVICRDLDSPLTYREAQAVQFWINTETKAAHAITDSISHTIPMLGGMIGFVPAWFGMKLNSSSWEELVSRGVYDWSVKGNDQTFLNNTVYPIFAKHGSDSIIQHYVLGMPNTFLNGYHNHIQNIEIPNVPQELNESNDVCGHIGAAGWYETAMFKFLRKYEDRFQDLAKVEKEYKSIFYWA
jgi:hypothetical protein